MKKLVRFVLIGVALCLMGGCVVRAPLYPPFLDHHHDHGWHHDHDWR